jgi:guanylate kinase
LESDLTHLIQESLSTSVTSHPILIVISGPSAVGKDAVLQRMKERQMPFHFVVTATSRGPRPGEIDGVDYIFITTAEFEDMIARGELLEHALVYGDYKGIPKEQIRRALDSGKDVVLRIDVQGAATLRRLCPDALLIFLTAEEDELCRRIRERKLDTPEEIQRRLDTACEELAAVAQFDFVIWNHEGRLDHTVDVIESIIASEHHRVVPRKVTL